MSRVNIKKYSMFILLALLAVFVFGCKHDTPVKDVYFNYEDQIVLLVGEDLAPNVVVTPSYATDKSYTLYSNDESIVSVVGNKIKAMAVGTTTIKVVSNDNGLLDDIIAVEVKGNPTALNKPAALKYSKDSQTISFDMVNNASGYVLDVDGQIIELGNSNSVSLQHISKFVGQIYDKQLSIKVKAKAPTYTKAFIDSVYSSELKVYQSGSVENLQVTNGVLTFDEKPEAVYDIYLNKSLWKQNVDTNQISMFDLNETYAGSELNIGVVAKMPNKTITNGYYPSVMSTLDVMVVDNANVAMNDGLIYWDAISRVNKYVVYIDGVKKAEVTNNHIALEDINFTVELNKEYELYVDTDLRNTTNVVKTNKHKIIKFEKLSVPTFSLDKQTVSWASNENASAYSIKLLNNGTELINTTTFETSKSFEKLNAGNYSLTIKYVGKFDGDKYYLSNSDTKEFTKNEAVNLSIENYTLKFNAVSDELYNIKIDNNEWEENTNGEKALNENYVSGPHEIFAYHVGNGETTLDSDVSSIPFVQLEKINAVTISNSIARVNIGDINKNNNAEIYFIVRDGSGNEIEKLSISEIGIENYNIIENFEKENKYIAGDYSISVQVLGNGGVADGVSTFSYLQNGEVVDCASANFTILGAPELQHISNAETKISVTGEASKGYDVYVAGSDKKTVTGNEYTFNLNSAESKTFSAVALGNGSSTLDSVMSNQLTITRLATPILMFNNTNNVITKQDNNEASFISSYYLTHNGTESNYNYEGEFVDLIEGENVFNLQLTTTKTNYVNSLVGQLKVNKITAATDILVDLTNKLVIETAHTTKQNLKVVFKTTQGEFTYSGEDLSCEFDNGKYIIGLLDANFKPVLPELSEDFVVKARFVTNIENVASSNYTEWFTVDLLNTTTLSRDGQNIKFEYLDTHVSASDYLLLLNYSDIANGVVVNIASAGIVDEVSKTISVPISVLSSYVTAGEINTVAVVTKNTNSTTGASTLANMGDSIKFVIEPTINLTSVKNNNTVNNSTMVSFNTYETAYYKKYILYINNADNSVTKIYEDEDEIITLALDEITIEGPLSLVGMVTTEDSSMDDGYVVYHFNSALSNTLTFEKVLSPTGFLVKDAVLSFDKVTNAVAYEIYEPTSTAGVYTFIDKITNNSYPLTAIVGRKQLVVKAISKEGYYTNSNISEIVVVEKLAEPVVSSYYGDLKIELSATAIDLLTNNENCVLIIKNNENGKETTLKIDDSAHMIDDSLIVSVSSILNYGATNLIPENIQVTIKMLANSDEAEINYINSSTVSSSVYGLLPVLNVSKTTTEDLEYEYVEFITWEGNTKNNLNSINLEGGYQFKIEYNGVAYYSNDDKLVYANNGAYKPYGKVISGYSCVFPYGYNVGAKEEVIFGAGTYKVSVKVVPVTDSGYNLCASKYSAECSFEIMETLKARAENGKITWTKNEKASGYVVRLYTDATTYTTTSVTTNEFDIGGQSSDIYGIQIQCINTSNDAMLNSAMGDIVKLYRLPVVEKAWVDNGRLYFKANKYFKTAKIEFIDTTDYSVKSLEYTNSKFEANIKNITAWDYTTDCSGSETYLVKIEDSDILNLVLNRTYKLNIQLLGNTSEVLGIINSAVVENVDKLLVGKLTADSIFDVKDGVLTYTNKGDKTEINYNFNDCTTSANQAEQDSFLKSAPVYKIDINVSSTPHTIYAVDYDSFINAIDNGEIVNEEGQPERYHLFTTEDKVANLYGYYIYNHDNTNKLYFNVFKNNEINLKGYDFLKYYKISEKLNSDKLTYTWNGEYSLTSIVLENGGTFIISAQVLGGDTVLDSSTSVNSAYLNSNIVESEKFVRYAVSQVSTEYGMVKFKDLSSEIDQPVYHLVVTEQVHKTVTNVYLYNGTKADASKVVSIGDNDIFIQIENAKNSDELEKLNAGLYDGNVYFNMSNKFVAGEYTINITTFAGVGDGENTAQDYLIDSKQSTDVTIKQLYESQIEYLNGKIVFERGYTLYSSTKDYQDYYEVTIIKANGQTFVYRIDNTSEGVFVNTITNKIEYTLPKSITYNSSNLNLTNSDVYEIKVRPLSKTEGIVSGRYYQVSNVHSTIKFKLSNSASSFRVMNGGLSWTSTEENVKFMIRLTYVDSDKNKIIEFDPQSVGLSGNYSYYFSDSYYPIKGTGNSVMVTNNYPYKAELFSYNTSINDGVVMLLSVPSEIATINRLASVSTIEANNGILTWNKVANTASYEIVVKQNGTNYIYNSTSENIDLMMSKDINGKSLLQAGNCTVNIKAIGDNYINSIDTISNTTFIILGSVDKTKIEIGEDGDTITWQPVENADAYSVVLKYDYDAASGYANSKATSTTACEFKVSSLGAAISGQFAIEIRAIGTSTNKFSGLKAEYTSDNNNAPDPVTNLDYDTENYKYTWSTQGEMQDSDKFVIRYTITHKNSSGDNVTENIETQIAYSAGVTDYEYVLKEIGVYSNFQVFVKRANTLMSFAATISEEKVFNLFDSGSGTLDSYYVVSTTVHLKNIAVFTDKYYKLGENIYLTADDLKEGYIIAETFNGVLDGDGYSIKLPEGDVDVSNCSDFALFKEINNNNAIEIAQISNLTIESAGSSTKFINSFANESASVLNLSMIATNVNNSTISDVVVRNVKFDLTISSSSLTGVYVSGLVSNINQGAILNSAVTGFEIVLKENNSVGATHIGGIVAVATNNVTISNSSNTMVSDLTLTNSGSTSAAYFVGGVVAKVSKDYGSAYENSLVTNVKINVNATNFYCRYFGGIVGMSEYATISSCSTSGNYSTASNSMQFDIGGIVGKANNTTLENVTSTVEFTITKFAGSYQYVGAIVGNITSGSIINGYTVNSAVTNNITSIQNSVISSLGVCGYAASGVTINK